MTPREQLQEAYEIAFFPPRLHRIWTDLKRNVITDKLELIETLKVSLTLHQALPEKGYSSFRALKRVAGYQAYARLFGSVTFLKNILSYLNVDFTPPHVIPGELIRDIGLPPFCSKKVS